MGLSSSHISSHSAEMRNKLPEKSKYSKAIRIALYQRDRMTVQRLTGYDPTLNTKQHLTAANATEDSIAHRFSSLHPDFTAQSLSVECFVELIEKRWDPETVQLFLYIQPTEEMLVTMLATCVLHNHYPVLEILLATIYSVAKKSGLYAFEKSSTAQDRSIPAGDLHPKVRKFPFDFVQKHNLQHLFPIVCHQNDETILMTFVEAGLFDPVGEGGAAALRIVAAAAIRMHARALQRYGNRILAPPPQTVEMMPSVAPQWFVAALLAPANGDAEQNATRVQGDGVGSAPIGTYSSHGGGSSATQVPPAAKCPLSDNELRQPLLDPSSGDFTNVSDSIAPYIAPLVLILSTFKYPGRDTIESIKAEALRTAVIKTKGIREVPGWQLYQQQLTELASVDSGPRALKAAVEVTTVPLLSPVASVLALVDGPWTADTHRMHSPSYRRNVRLLFHILTRKQVGLTEDDVNSILAYLPE
eukprot:GILI01023416.1.p1 GENE.GILI01023416.1~~GILI01023416.1.p1  ORF type:complete len:472 (-),score=62.14 GILI01023416.1:87-1502(-)